MRIAVTTPNGHVGSAVTMLLLDAGVDVILLARDGRKLTEQIERGAELAEGALQDEAYLTRATSGADALFWVTPTDFSSPDYRSFQNLLAESAAMAVRRNHIQRVVNISSVGAQLPMGAGPVSGLHDVEEVLDEVCPNVTHLRPGFFFENFLYQLDSMRDDSSIYLSLSPSVAFPMVATADIAQVVVECLLNGAWGGRVIRGVHGPADLTFEQAAEQISQGIGRHIRYVQVGQEAVRQFLHSAGASDDVTNLMLEMYEAIDGRIMIPQEPRSAETTTPTTLAEWSRKVLAPLLQPAAAAL